MRRCCLILVIFSLLICGMQTKVYATSIEDLADKGIKIVEIDVVPAPRANDWEWQPKAMQIKDQKMIKDILSMITAGHLLSDNDKIKHISGMKATYKIRLIYKDYRQQEITLIYDRAFPIGYIEIEGQKYEVNYSFFRYMNNLNQYRTFNTTIEAKVVNLFKQFNWQIDYKAGEDSVTLPTCLKYEAGEFPHKIYWAYNNELSKAIGLDFSKYLGKTVSAETYRLREPLPDYMKPYEDASGIVLKYNGRIVGAYIETGRHRSFACSLHRKNLKDITGLEWGEWIGNYVDYSSAFEIELLKMSPEDVIKQYYDAKDKHDIKMQFAYRTLRRISINMDNNQIFNSNFKQDQNTESVKIINLRRLGGDSERTLIYEVLVDEFFKQEITIPNGIHIWYVTLKKENPQSGWKIVTV